MDDLWTDLRHSVRSLSKQPLLSLVVIATLTAGVGISSGVFTLFDAAVLRPHVGPAPESFAQVYVTSTADRSRPARRSGVTLDEYRSLAQARSFRALVAHRRYAVRSVRSGNLGVPVLLVTCNFFEAYGTPHALLGRLLEADDCATGRPVVVIDEGFWRARLNADPAVIGSSLDLNGSVVTIVGVAPREAAQLDDAAAWTPYSLRRYVNLVDNTQVEGSEDRWLSLWGRLAPGVSRPQAAAELALLEAQEDRLHPGRTTVVSVTDGSIAADPDKPLVIPIIGLVMGALSCLVLIACANVATLLLARADARQQEIAIRLSLGAGRGRLLRMLLTETLILAAAAGIASVYLAYQVPIVLFNWFGGALPAYSVAPNWRAFAYLAASAAIAGIVAGVAPALESLRVDVLDSLKGRRSVLGTAGGGLLRNALIGVQVALGFVLLVGAALFGTTHYRILTAEPGFESAHLLVARAPAPPDAIAGALGGLPGTREIAFASAAPMFRPDTAVVAVEEGEQRSAEVNEVSPGYFAAVGLRILRGRALADGDRPCDKGTCPVVISNAFAGRFVGGDALGRTLRTGTATMVIVGVVSDSAAQFVGQPDPPVVYAPWTPSAPRYQAVVRFDGDPTDFSQEASAALRQRLPGEAVDARTARWYIDAWIDEIGPAEILFLALGIAAAGLAVIGVFGVVSFSVSRRTREIGIRVALGARASDIHRAVLGAGLRPAVAGLAAGVVLAFGTAVAFANVLGRLHFAVRPEDPVIYGAVAALLTAIIAAALVHPARRAARTDPLIALRYE